MVKKRYKTSELRENRRKREARAQLRKIGLVCLGIALGALLFYIISSYLDFMETWYDYIQLPVQMR